MATLRDVARRAGVSISTVSHVINGYDDINDETQKRVLQAIRELNYHPNALARNLLKQRSQTFGVVTFGRQSENHPFLSQIILALASGVQDLGFGVNVSVFDPDEDDVERFVSNWHQQRLEGLFAIGFAEDGPLVETIVNGKIPAVFIDTKVEGERSRWVASDNFGGAFRAVSHLIQQGHTRIGFIQGVPHGQIIQDRFLGYKKALETASIPYDDALYEQADFTKEGAYRAVNRMLSRTQPTAIFCVSDLMAFGAIACAKDRGLSVPDSLAVVGFDDIPAAEHVSPTLTTVRQSGYEMGRTAVEIMLQLVEETRNDVNVVLPKSVLLPTQLIIRESCGVRQGIT